MTRAVNVDALRPCSAPTMKYASRARAVSPDRASCPVSCWRKPPARSRHVSGSTGSRPCRRRPKAASADGENAVSARACSGVGGQASFCAGAPDRDRRPQRVHRVGVRRKRPERHEDRLGDGRRVELDAGMPLAGPQQVGDLGVRAAGDELADRVAAVQEAAVLAVDEADRALGADDALEAGRVRPLVGGCGRRRRAWGRAMVSHGRMVEWSRRRVKARTSAAKRSGWRVVGGVLRARDDRHDRRSDRRRSRAHVPSREDRRGCRRR